jgi:hypothetical protein
MSSSAHVLPSADKGDSRNANMDFKMRKKSKKVKKDEKTAVVDGSTGFTQIKVFTTKARRTTKTDHMCIQSFPQLRGPSCLRGE